MTGDQVRAVLLDLEGVEERAHMGHPDFRLGGRIFASLMADERRGMVKITPAEQAVLIAQAPETFVPAAGAWGRQGCTMIDLAAADPAVVRGALVLAWEIASAARRAPRARTKGPGGRARRA